MTTQEGLPALATDDWKLCDFCGRERPAEDECEPDDTGHCIACGEKIEEGQEP